MKDHLDDEFLYKHIPMAEKSVIDAIPPEDELNHAFSVKFLRKMKVLINYERRGTFGRAAVRFGRSAAAVLLIVILLNTVLVVSVDAYREQFFEIIQTVTEKFTSFVVDVDDDAPVTELVPIEPPYIPEGFELVERFNDGIHYNLVYQNPLEVEISYFQAPTGFGVVCFDTEDALVETIQIAGQMVYVITEDDMIQVYWIDDTHAFLITSNYEHDEILSIAEAIINKK
jgi:hypothetical protein